MSTKRTALLMAAVATGTTLLLLMVFDVLQGSSDPSVWTNTLGGATAVLVICFVSVSNRERLERGHEKRKAEQDIAEILDISNVRSFR